MHINPPSHPPPLPPRSSPPPHHHLPSCATQVYWNFFLDFGPLNLGQLYRFCEKLNNKLRDRALANTPIYFYSSTHPHRRTNAAMLICSWMVTRPLTQTSGSRRALKRSMPSDPFSNNSKP